MEKKNQENDTRVEVELEGAIEVKPLDISPYIGMKAKISTVDVHYNKEYGSYYMRIATEPVAYVNDDPDKPVTASKLYGLLSQDGKFGWKKDGDLDNFLKSQGVKTPEELKGKEVLLLPTKPNKDGQRFLQFN